MVCKSTRLGVSRVQSATENENETLQDYPEHKLKKTLTNYTCLDFARSEHNVIEA